MPQLLVRDLAPEVIETLKARAHAHGRSLQKEIKAILEEAAALSMPEARAIAQAWQQHFASRPFSDSTELVREDRGR